MPELNGHCMCGAVTWAYDGPVGRNLVCHCESCRRATSSGFAAFIHLEPDLVEWSGDVTHYESSPDTYRGFCPTCGTRLYFASDNWPGEMHIHAGTLSDPASYAPDVHVVWSERAKWVVQLETLPKKDGFD